MAFGARNILPCSDKALSSSSKNAEGRGSNPNSCLSWDKRLQRDARRECLDGWPSPRPTGSSLLSCFLISTIPPFLKKMYIAAVTISRFGFFPLPPERGRGQKALLFGSARPYLCLAPAPRPGQHPRTLGQCHVCHPTGNGVSPALTWPDRCVPQAGDLTQGSFMDVVDTERSKGERGGERAGVPRWACFAPHKRVKRPRRSPPPHPSFLSAGKCF